MFMCRKCKCSESTRNLEPIAGRFGDVTDVFLAVKFVAHSDTKKLDGIGLEGV